MRLFDADIIPSLPTLSKDYQPAIVDHNGFDIYKTIRKVIKKDSIVSPDIKIDDSDFRLAPNFFKFTTGEKFLKQKPFLEQALLGTIIFAEYCVAKGTRIITNRGIIRIEDLVETTKLGMNPLKGVLTGTRNGVKKVSHSGITARRKKCLTISTSSNNSLIVTPPHKILTLTKDLNFAWVATKHLKVGDYVIESHSYDLWPKKPPVLNDFDDILNELGEDISLPNFIPLETVSSELARLSGYLVANGRIGKNKIRFTNTDLKLVKDYELCILTIFGKKPDRITKQLFTGTTSYEVCFDYILAADYLKHIGLIPGLGSSKEIPEFIMQSTKEHVIDFIRALFDCEGNVLSSKTYGGKSGRVSIHLNNKKIVDLLDLLLVNLGIVGVVKYSTTKYVVKIGNSIERRTETSSCEGSPRKYASIVGSKHSTKSKECLNILKEQVYLGISNSTTLSGSINPGSVPFWKETVEDIIANSSCDGEALKNIVPYLVSTYKFALLFRTTDFEEFCKRNGRMVTFKKLKRLERLNYRYGRITAIEDAGIHSVYDLTVPSNESFFANGIVIHNCPRCSDLKWMKKHNVDDSLGVFEDRVQLLTRGKCPKCKARKSEMVLNKELNYYYEAALCIGQRGGKSAWLGMMSAYMAHWLLMLQNPNEIYGLLSSSILHGTFVALTYAQAKDTLWEPFYGYLLDSPWFCLVEGTPIRLSDGSTVSIQDALDLEVRTFEGNNKVSRVFDNGFQECFELVLENSSTVIGSAKHQVRCLSKDHISLEWKNLADLTEDDFVVVE
jgi:intein/homing endonuclease